MPDIDISAWQPLIFVLALALGAALVWTIIKGAIGGIVSLVVLGVAVYVGLWVWSGQQPIMPAEFGAWLDDLPDTVDRWITEARAWLA